MTWGEIGIRLKRWMTLRLWQLYPPRSHHRHHWQPAPFVMSDLVFDQAEVIRAADDYLAHRWHYGTMPPDGLSIAWHNDNIHTATAPLTFCLDVPYRDVTQVGDVRLIWEKNRHQHLTILALAYALTLDERYSDEVAHQLLDWWTHNPFLYGVNWCSAMECGLRLLAWVWCERLLRGSRAHTTLFRDTSIFWESLYQHQVFIRTYYARASSANNHLVGEMAGLLAASLHWPVFPDSEQWCHFAHTILEHAIATQVSSSGLLYEQSYGYHVFCAELFFAAWYEVALSQMSFSTSYEQRLKRMIDVAAFLRDDGGNPARFGDFDDGIALPIWPRTLPREAVLLEATARLMTLDSESQPDVRERGWYVFSTAPWWVLVDMGPHGDDLLAAHAHADALSVTFSFDGQPVLIDPGTYCYYANPSLRDYFRSTPAHNTLVVDGQNQSLSSGMFLWRRQAQVFDVSADETRVRGSHNGYGPLICSRHVSLQSERLLIRDEVKGEGEHTLTLYFHFHPECVVQRLSNSQFQITQGTINLTLTLNQTLQTRILRGDPEGGWYSRGYYERQPTTTLVASVVTSLPYLLETSFSYEKESGHVL